MKIYIKLAMVLGLLSGCGAGGSEGVSDTGSGNAVTYSELFSLNYQLRYDSARLFTEQGWTENLPDSGTAKYAGTAFFSEDASPAILAQATLQVNFNDASMSGSLYDFRGDDGTVFDGLMVISNGNINNSDSSVSAVFNGQLTSSSAAMSTVDVSGQFDGGFIDDNYTYVRGDTSAVWVTNAGTVTEETRTMSGELTAVKQY